MEITFTPTKEIFVNYSSGYRVLSCRLNGGQDSAEMKLDPYYHNFKIAGSNIFGFKVGEQAEANVREDLDNKYDYTYVVIGLPGLKIEKDQIVVDRDKEYSILCRLMSGGQAQNIIDAYPDFVQQVLRGEEEQLDYHNIYNVGPVYFEQYVEKIKQECKSILFYPICDSWGITDNNAVCTLSQMYESPEFLAQALNDDPYKILIDVAGFGFKKADKLIIQRVPELEVSLTRAERYCEFLLTVNETESGCTCIHAGVLKYLLLDTEDGEGKAELAQYVVDAIMKNPRIHYDPDTKMCGLKTTYDAENTIAENVVYRMQNSEDLHMDWEKYKIVDGFECTDEQVKILKLASKYNVSILTGSAGTGKTTSVKALVRMLEGHGETYTLLAPTGIAAKRLRESTGRNASTIHMFLAKDEIAGEFVLVDEMSMVSVELLGKLLDEIGTSPRLVFVCDQAQLASISAGNIVQDLIDSGMVPRANLSKVFRYGIGGISTVATDVRNGQQVDFTKSWNDCTFIDDDGAPIDTILDQYSNLLTHGYTKEDILILCPVKVNKYGTYKINEAIQERFNPNEWSKASYKADGAIIRFKMGDRVVNTKNNYRCPSMEFDDDGNLIESERLLPVMNGDIGYIIRIEETSRGMEIAVQFDNGIGLFIGTKFTDLLPGYAITVHKSQGCQSKAVIVGIGKNHYNVSRNLEYVAISRAQEKLVIVSDSDTINSFLDKEENKIRTTWLVGLMKKINENWEEPSNEESN